MIPNTAKWRSWRTRQIKNGIIANQHPLKQVNGKKWPIGSHKGKPVTELKTSYLNWVIKNFDSYSLAYQLAQWEIRRRHKPSK